MGGGLAIFLTSNGILAVFCASDKLQKTFNWLDLGWGLIQWGLINNSKVFLRGAVQSFMVCKCQQSIV